MTRAPESCQRAPFRFKAPVAVCIVLLIGALFPATSYAAAPPKFDLVALLTALLMPPAIAIDAPVAKTVSEASPVLPEPADESFLQPVDGEFLSGFGRRADGMHTGLDLRGRTGDPIHASRKGTISAQACGSGYGICTMIDHGGGLTTLYAHMSSRTVGSGPVERGQVIGLVGCTGSCETPHLHFEVRENGVRMDPLRYL
jgi:murein DD-endopeptidase MepM/ murein hydrolase activator NlpD